MSDKDSIKNAEFRGKVITELATIKLDVAEILVNQKKDSMRITNLENDKLKLRGVSYVVMGILSFVVTIVTIVFGAFFNKVL